MSRSRGDRRGGRMNGEVARVGDAKVVGRRVVASGCRDVTGDPAHKRDSKRLVARAARRAGVAEARAGLSEEAFSEGRPREGSRLVAQRFVRVMADHGAEGVWDRDGRLADAADLPVDDDLRRRLVDWSARFRLEDPEDGEGPDAVEAARHRGEGRALARAVKDALPDWTVVHESFEVRAREEAA